MEAESADLCPRLEGSCQKQQLLSVKMLVQSVGSTMVLGRIIRMCGMRCTSTCYSLYLLTPCPVFSTGRARLIETEQWTGELPILISSRICFDANLPQDCKPLFEAEGDVLRVIRVTAADWRPEKVRMAVQHVIGALETKIHSASTALFCPGICQSLSNYWGNLLCLVASQKMRLKL